MERVSGINFFSRFRREGEGVSGGSKSTLFRVIFHGRPIVLLASYRLQFTVLS